jgi:hypothetical protein
MRAALVHSDELLRGTGAFAPAAHAVRPWWWLFVMIVVFAPIYGAVMGGYHFDSLERIRQIAYSAAKVPLLLFAASMLCLPGFFVLNTVLGLRDDLREAFQAILAGQGALSVALASLAPLTGFWYFSEMSYRAALLFNAGAFALATVAGHIVMLRYYRVLIARNRHHRIALYVWLALYAFVGIQMGWTLRPFIGDPGMNVTFFRQGPFTNAYVVVADLIFGSH